MTTCHQIRFLKLLLLLAVEISLTHLLLFQLHTKFHQDKAIVLTLQNIAKIAKMKYLMKLMFPFHLQFIYIVSYLNAHHHGYIMITVRLAWKWPGFKIQIS